MKPLWIAVFALILGACAATESAPNLQTEEEIASASDRDLCLAFRHKPSNSLRGELVRRDVFSRFEWSLVDEREVRVGMSELAVVCSWGEPERVVVLESNADGEAVAEEWAYNTCAICNEIRIYFQQGQVDRWEQ